jgi:hypothetical protein
MIFFAFFMLMVVMARLGLAPVGRMLSGFGFFALFSFLFIADIVLFDLGHER